MNTLSDSLYNSEAVLERIFQYNESAENKEQSIRKILNIQDPKAQITDKTIKTYDLCAKIYQYINEQQALLFDANKENRPLCGLRSYAFLINTDQMKIEEILISTYDSMTTLMENCEKYPKIIHFIDTYVPKGKKYTKQLEFQYSNINCLLSDTLKEMVPFISKKVNYHRLHGPKSDLDTTLYAERLTLEETTTKEKIIIWALESFFKLFNIPNPHPVHPR